MNCAPLARHYTTLFDKRGAVYSFLKIGFRFLHRHLSAFPKGIQSPGKSHAYQCRRKQTISDQFQRRLPAFRRQAKGRQPVTQCQINGEKGVAPRGQMPFAASKRQHGAAAQQRANAGNGSGVNDVAKPNRRKAQHAAQRFRRQGEYRPVNHRKNQA